MASTGPANVSISTWHITNIEFARRLRAAGWVAEGSQLRDPSGNLLRDCQFVIVGPDGRETTADDPLHKRLEVFLVQRHMVAFGEPKCSAKPKCSVCCTCAASALQSGCKSAANGHSP